MQENDGDRYNGSTSNAYTPNMARPGRQISGHRRTALKIALCILLPPVGLVYIWRTCSFRARGRVLASVLALASMLVMCLPMFRQAQLTPILPQAVVPSNATHAPETDTVSALSNIEELLKAEDAAGADEAEATVDPDATEEPTMTREEILNTIVYSVYSGAQFYHAGPTCGTQANRRQLTVQEALSEGMTPCAKCNPVAPE